MKKSWWLSGERFLVISILTMMLLGQLTRVNLTPQIAFYWHDVAIVIFVLMTAPKQIIRMMRNPILYHKSVILSSLMVIFAVFSWYINGISTITPLLYCGRLAVYAAFGWLLREEKLFDSREWQEMLLVFFASLAILGLIQYWFLPDTRWLEDMGWDDHYYRLIGTWFDPAFSALGFVLGWLWAHLSARQGILKKRKGLARAIETLIILALILTYSRSGYLAAGICAGVWLLKQKKQILPSWRQKKNRKVMIMAVGAAIIMATIYGYLAWKHPSDSTNLLRTNSINIRAEMLQWQLGDIKGWQWLYGRGVFVPLTSASKQVSPADQVKKKTAAFPDNFELLLVSFLGLPMATWICWRTIVVMKKWWQTNDERFYYLLATLVCAQFNQAMLQPLIVLTLIMLENERWTRHNSTLLKKIIERFRHI